MALGASGTLIGAGGGWLVVPVLLFLYPRSPATVVTSISLTVVALNALSGSIAYARRHRIDYHVALVLAAASVPATMLGAAATSFIPRLAFEVVFGALILTLAAFLFWRPVKSGTMAPGSPAAVSATPAAGRLATGLPASFAVGFLSGVMGIGGSPLQVVVLTHLMDVSVHTAMPTAQFVILLSSLGGVVTHAGSGHFDFDLRPLVLLGGGAVVGAPLGARLSEWVSTGTLVRLMAVALVVVGLRLVLAAVRGAP